MTLNQKPIRSSLGSFHWLSRQIELTPTQYQKVARKIDQCLEESFFESSLFCCDRRAYYRLRTLL